VSIHLGHFLTHDVTMAMAAPPWLPTKYAKFIWTEGKGSDVNPATQPVARCSHGQVRCGNGCLERFRSAGADQNRARSLHKPVGVLNPQKNPSPALLPLLDFIKQIRAVVLKAGPLCNVTKTCSLSRVHNSRIMHSGGPSTVPKLDVLWWLGLKGSK
jgi:hypothetical protein